MIWYAKNVKSSWPTWSDLKLKRARTPLVEDQIEDKRFRNDMLIGFGLKLPPKERKSAYVTKGKGDE